MKVAVGSPGYLALQRVRSSTILAEKTVANNINEPTGLEANVLVCAVAKMLGSSGTLNRTTWRLLCFRSSVYSTMKGAETLEGYSDMLRTGYVGYTRLYTHARL